MRDEVVKLEKIIKWLVQFHDVLYQERRWALSAFVHIAIVNLESIICEFKVTKS